MTALSNPRFGVDRTTGIVLEQMRVFYNADLCLSVTIDPGTGAYRMRRADRDNSESAVHVDSMPAELGNQLLALPAEHAMVYRSSPWRWWWGSNYYGYDLQTGERSDEGCTACEGVARTLDAESFLSIPLYHNSNPYGRLYVTASRRYAFHSSDVEFLLQVSAHITPILDSIRLVDKLAFEAAEEERQRIARDLHDSVIQPYIGLQIGLGALRRKLASGADVTGEVEQLIALTTEGIGELRGYVQGLKSSGEAEGDLLPSLRRFAARFAAATGIEVQIQAQDVVHINHRLAAEVFQMVAEGLSNVRRHTHAPRATVNLSRRADHLVVWIEDEGTPEALPALFTPRSITERAAALGGQAHVERRADNGARVVVEIPL
jgi:signal transduction histidine kinase